MNLFKKHKEMKLGSGQEKIAEGIAGRILKAQRRIADYLNAISKDWTPYRWKFLLVTLCLSFGSYCIYLLWQAFN
ncbi:hypothetical protein [Pedobacter helvus]|uniref:Uncharacterized protein n=1 Tax=Pedobacter helvus TaxID=2563444 RepID=A0ABW9JDE1_9SPHI|nr:hypothetical protein [Pedobacter ureilyticus]